MEFKSLKETIRTSPFLVYIRAFKHYSSPGLLIEIEVSNEHKYLMLCSEGFYLKKPGEHFFKYDNHGRAFFVRLISSFRKIKVYLSEGKTEVFDNYDNFMEKIISDVNF